jgi:Fe-S-cluster containining protein
LEGAAPSAPEIGGHNENSCVTTGRFECQRCGQCCRHRGEVRLESAEVEAIAAWLGLAAAAFTETYARLRPDRRGLSLREHPDGACVFLETNPPACRIQPVKPAQCRAFPHTWRYAPDDPTCPALAAPDRP